MSDAKADKPVFTQPIVAEPDRKFFLKRMLIATVVAGVACWFFYDGFVKYPKHQQRVFELQEQIAVAEKAKDETTLANLNKEAKDLGPPHSELNMLLQKVGGFPLAAVALFLYVKFLKESKGQLKLENDTLFAPGHPPVPINAITGVNNVRWDKKGIAIFDYKLPDGTSGRVRIDDFVFFRPPTDAIHDELIAKMPKAQEL